MKIILPDGKKLYVKQTSPLDEKMVIVDKILEEYSSYFEDNWESQKVAMCLSVLADYIVRGNNNGKHDKEILSDKKDIAMRNGHKCIPFSSLSKRQKIMLGLIEVEDTDE